MEYFIIGTLWWILVVGIGGAGYHRYWTHRSFKAPIWYEYASLFLGLFAGLRSVKWWVGVHRVHHMFHDTVHDPHSPVHTGFWKVMLTLYPKDVTYPKHLVDDIVANPRAMFFTKWGDLIWALCAVALIFWPDWFTVFIIIPYIFGKITWAATNVAGHWPGYPVDNPNWSWNILSLGESWHKHHHDYPGDPNLSGKWDIAYWIVQWVRTDK